MEESQQVLDGIIQLQFEQFANEEGVYAKTINGDAFSKEIKNLTIETIKKDLGKVDLVVYALQHHEEQHQME